MYPYQFPYASSMGMPRAGLMGFFKTGGLKAGLGRVNFGSLLNNASKTLGVVNQALPLVKEAGPMISNMRSMLKIASVFKDETDNNSNNFVNNSNSTVNSNRDNNYSNNNSSSYNNNYNSPNFFI